ncbi:MULTISPECIES: PspC domain-containing protein [Alteribacter]|uniref:PspC domain-containing protein n=1 Tax=Alteribacter keqinensis TaxID=2483800 RepID=A0A3M7TP24_9BACI|nr:MULTISPECIES: PspC domain-containing protein [Alteribacter]MBM7095259.1 PspC domain-containing protein [Alteribacter salitolerans]RNA67004.1 PspC domain-containing protein [Alteribacter keqinensis]
MSNRKFYKSTTDVKASGVLAGIAEYYNWDPTIVRLVFAIATLLTSIMPGVIVYIIADWVMPKDTEKEYEI